MPALYISSSTSDSTTNLLFEQRGEKDYAAAFGVLADTYGFSIPNGASRAPPPSPVDATYSPQTPSSSPCPPSPTTDSPPSLRNRFFAVLRKGTQSVASQTPSLRRWRRSAPNLRSLVPSSRKPGIDSDKVRKAREYEAVFVSLQAEYDYVIGASLLSDSAC
ncbi:hypothetical protein A7U60_g3933 [Sanghuangporus baumii]|uniref:Uncharacterized protein n=1 Tax=Sanghuangporus baumii TaxID=108892 RepID=A0A9Q5HZM3_SANBA|nr:hypothetical protein A7U60_g3933 [Sanghuangporus baumii]